MALDLEPPISATGVVEHLAITNRGVLIMNLN